ncbi:MAG: hypothetical protein ACYCVS_14050 [Acidimicrobiales bacterium]
MLVIDVPLADGLLRDEGMGCTRRPTSRSIMIPRPIRLTHHPGRLSALVCGEW